MEPLPTQRMTRRCAAAIGLSVLLLGSGCVATSSALNWMSAKPTGTPVRLACTWIPSVVSTPDPTKGGAPVQGIAGRVYLFGEPAECPLAGDGALVVMLFDDTNPAAPNDRAPLEEWRFDRDTLKRLVRKDAYGYGYTLFLPWSTIRPEITKVHCRVRYDPAGGGSPLYTECTTVTLNKEMPRVTVTEKNGFLQQKSEVTQASPR